MDFRARILALARSLQPIPVLLGGLSYFLGVSIARYLGSSASPLAFWSGLGVIVLTLLAMNLLATYFGSSAAVFQSIESPSDRRVLRDMSLYLAASALAAAGLMILVLYADSRLTAQAILCLVLFAVFAVGYAVPPISILDRGLGELDMAIQIAYLAPAIGFVLQAGDYHGLLNACIVPLTLMLLATMLALDFQSYAEDLTRNRFTLLVRIGWELAVPVHHFLLLGAYGLLAIAMLLGYSRALLWPAFLTIPFAVLQALILRAIAQGARPLWALLRANAIALYGLTAYFLAVSFWLR